MGPVSPAPPDQAAACPVLMSRGANSHETVLSAQQLAPLGVEAPSVTRLRSLKCPLLVSLNPFPSSNSPSI